MQSRFTFRDGITLTGIKARQLQWRDERRLAPPEWERPRRLHTTRHLSEVARRPGFRCKAFSPPGVRKAMRPPGRELGQTLAETVARSSQYHRLTDGAHLYIQSSAREIVDILKNSNQSVLGMCLTDVTAGSGRDCPRKGEYFGNVA